MTSRYDAKYLRGSGLRRRPLASPSHADIDPRWTCPSTAAHRRAQRRAGRQWSPHSTPGSGGTRAHTIGVDPGTVAPPHWSLMPQDLVRASEDTGGSSFFLGT